jgi:hypothetical protein
MTGKVILFPPGVQNISFAHSVRIRSEAHPVFSGGTGGFFLGVKGATQRSRSPLLSLPPPPFSVKVKNAWG